MKKTSRIPKPSPALPYLARIIEGFGRIYNGFESRGTENIPKEGPGLVVFFHGLIPIDAWYFGLQYYLQTGRLIRGMGDRWLFRTPGVAWLVKAVGGLEGNPDVAIQLLKEGNLVGVSPGGVREAIKGDSNKYKLVWGSRVGFARVAIEANVPIIPGFTQNIEETYRAPFAEKRIFQKLYEKTRLPLVPMIGFGFLPFPVKLVTWIGPAVHPLPGDTPESLAARVKTAMEVLIKKHQPSNSSVLSGITERLTKRKQLPWG